MKLILFGFILTLVKIPTLGVPVPDVTSQKPASTPPSESTTQRTPTTTQAAIVPIQPQPQAVPPPMVASASASAVSVQLSQVQSQPSPYFQPSNFPAMNLPQQPQAQPGIGDVFNGFPVVGPMMGGAMSPVLGWQGNPGLLPSLPVAGPFITPFLNNLIKVPSTLLGSIGGVVGGLG